MQGVEAGADLHPLHLVHGLTVGEVEPGLLQAGTAVGEIVLDDQILALLGVDIGGLDGAPGVAHRREALQAVLLQHGAHAQVRAWGDLVDHGPGEGHLFPVLDIGLEALVAPGFGKGGHGRFELVAVVGAVVGAHHGNGRRAGPIALQQQSRDSAHVALGLLRGQGQVGLHVLGLEAVALLGDGKAGQLQGGIAEDLLQPLLAAVEIAGLGHGAEDVLLHAAVGFQGHHHGQIVILLAAPVHTLHGDDAAVQLSLVQKPLGCHPVQRLEDIARAKVQPGGLLPCPGDHGLPVIFRQPVALGFPSLSVF